MLVTTSYVYSSGCFVVAGRIYVLGFLSSDFLPLLWFISGIGDMEEGGSDCIAREGDNLNTSPCAD